MYHYTRDLVHNRYPQIKGLDVNLFKKQLDFFKCNFNVVSMEQVIESIKGNNNLPENALLLTFDDGYIDNYTVAMPILQDYGMQGSFFIPGKTFTTYQLLDVNKIHYILASANIMELTEALKTELEYYRGIEFDYPSYDELFGKYAVASRFDVKETIFFKQILQTVLPESLRNTISSNLFKKYVDVSEEQLARELYMTDAQIRTMKRNGMYIGVHGYDHYWLGNMKKEALENDISKALDIMNEFINPNEWVMNYPYGSYNQDVINFIESQGACAGLTTEVRIADLTEDSPFTLPRLDCNDFPPKSEKYKLL